MARLRFLVSGSAQCFRTFRAELATEPPSVISIDEASIEETVSASLERVHKRVVLSGVSSPGLNGAFRCEARITAPLADCSLQLTGDEARPVSGHPSMASASYTDFDLFASDAVPRSLTFESEGPVLDAGGSNEAGGFARMLGFFFSSNARVARVNWSIKLPAGRRLLGGFPKNDGASPLAWTFSYSGMEAGSALNASLLIG